MVRLLETQKTYVREDLQNFTCAMVVVFTADGASELMFPKFQDEASKISAYAGVVEHAKARSAVMIVTVNDALTSKGQGPTDFVDYRWSDLNPTNAERCILLTASGPGLQNASLKCVFTVSNEDVTFHLAEFQTGDLEIGLLPGWPKQLQSPIN